jgi:hypothetical protein
MRHSLGIAASLTAIACAVASSANPAGGAPSGVRGDAESPLIACGGGPPFPAKALDRPPNAERGRSPLARVLRRAVHSDHPELPPIDNHGWRLLSRNSETAQFGEGKPRSLDLVELHKGPGGNWKPHGLSWQCWPNVFRESFEAAQWLLSDNEPHPAPQSTSLKLDVYCAGADGLVTEVEYGAKAVRIGIFAPAQDPDPETCPDHPIQVDVELAEPLGDRALADTGYYPPMQIFP